MGQEQSSSPKHLDDLSPTPTAVSLSSPSAGRRKTASSCRGNVSPGMFIHQQAGNFSDRYQGLKVLGKGSFGEVILCKDKITGAECAVKVISKKSLKKGSDTSSLLREVELLRHLDHPNIMKLFEFFEDSGYFYLVGEVYSGGELFDAIVEQKRFSEQDASRLIKQVLSGVAFMHLNKIVHRDLKPENLLLESKQKDSLIKIIDFGLSTHFEAKTGEKMKDKIGTAYYIAPEVLHGTYDEKCDIWSTGVILYILLSGCPPFYGTTEYDILKRVELGKFSFNLPQWRKISEAAKDLIRRMLFYVPSMRMTAQEALDHEWIRRMSAAPLTDLPELESALCNIRQFQGSQRLAQAALLYMGSKLVTASETKALTEIFRSLDINGDGRLDRQELLEGYRELMKLKGIDVRAMDQETISMEIDQVLDSADFDKNGFIEVSEFLTVAMDRRSLLSTSRLQRAFDLFDVDGSGKISKDELATIFEMGKVDKEEWDAIMNEVDVNKDGEVDFEEFTTMLRKLCDDADG